MTLNKAMRNLQFLMTFRNVNRCHIIIKLSKYLKVTISKNFNYLIWSTANEPFNDMVFEV